MPASAAASRSVQTVRVAAGTSAFDALQAAGTELNGPGGAVVVRDADGELRDLAWVPDADADVVPVRADSPDGLELVDVYALTRVEDAGLELSHIELTQNQ